MATLKKTYSFFLFFIILQTANAQDLFYKTYTWQSNPKLTSVANLDQTEGQIILKDEKIIEYAYEKSGDLVMYITKYKLIKVFSDKGIEQNNKIYISSSGVIEFMDIKARAISPTGKISNIEKNNIKDVDDVENKGSFKMFAVEGIEKNSEIEYLYTYKKPVGYFGTEIAQSETPRLNYSVKVISPKNLTFEGKLYNTPTQVIKDTLTGSRNIISIKLDKVDALEDEKYCFYKANLIRLEYKLAYNTVRGAARLFSWDNAADRYYRGMCVPDKKVIATVNTFLKKVKINGNDELSKVRELENYLKAKYELKESQLDEYEDIEKIISNKYANQTGITKLYLYSLAQLGIKTELVLTCDRVVKKFDSDFDTWNYLNEYLIYLPTSNTYLSPGDVLSRVGFATPNYVGQKSMFIKEVDLGQGEAKSGIAKIKTITNTDYTLSNSTIDADVSFTEDLTQTVIKLKQTYTGYGAYYTQPLMGFLNDLQKKEFEETTLKITGEDAIMEKTTMSGIAENEILVKPFVLTCELKSPSLLAKAGNKYLLKAGLLIGPQAEMYQEGKRKTPPQILYTHMFNRKLIINIPNGYKVSNSEKLNIQQKFMQDDKILAQFISTYTINENVLEVTIAEEYRVLDYPLDKFEEYRKVINAAADFNKIELVIEKK